MLVIKTIDFSRVIYVKMLFSSQRREMVVFLITNIWPTWRHMQTSGKNLGVFVCVCLRVGWGGGGELDGEGKENVGEG